MHQGFKGTWSIKEVLLRETWKEMKRNRKEKGKKTSKDVLTWGQGESASDLDHGVCAVLLRSRVSQPVRRIWMVPDRQSSNSRFNVTYICQKKIASFFDHLNEAKSLQEELFFIFPFSFIRKEGTKCGHFTFACINILMSL